MRLQKSFLVLFCLCFSFSLFSAPVNVRVDSEEINYTLHKDKTYEETQTQSETLLTQQGIDDRQKISQTYFPDTETLTVENAYVLQPDGTKVEVPKANIFTRPSLATESAPGFTNSLTTTVVFPQLKIGSKIFVKWILKEIKPSPFGINLMIAPDFRAAVTKQIIRVVTPKSLHLIWGVSGNYKSTTQEDDAQQIITAVLKNKPAKEEENSMVSDMDVSSVFAASTMQSWSEVGRIYWKQSRDKVAVTPIVKALSMKIVGKRRGLKAAQALYNWVATHIHYVAVYLNQAAGYVPHSADSIIKNGFGDCKDHVVLLEALLAAQHIDAETALISAGDRYQVLPVATVYQFNHVIIYLPRYHIFADPTNRYASFGMLGLGENGKFVVLAGYQPRPTFVPPALSADNRYELDNQLTLNANGMVTGRNHASFFGSLNLSIRRLASLGISMKRLANEILSSTPEGGDGDLSITNPADLDHAMSYEGKWTSPYAVLMHQQTYFSVPIGLDLYYPQSLRKFMTLKKRLYAIMVGAATYTWKTTLHLPALYHVTHLPTNVNFENKAGSYQSTYRRQNGHIIRVNRQLIFQQDVYTPKEYYNLLVLLYRAIADTRAIVGLQRQ